MSTEIIEVHRDSLIDLLVTLGTAEFTDGRLCIISHVLQSSGCQGDFGCCAKSVDLSFLDGVAAELLRTSKTPNEVPRALHQWAEAWGGGE